MTVTFSLLRRTSLTGTGLVGKLKSFIICLFFTVEEKVIVVIGGDDNYKNVDEEEQSVISRWARRIVRSQFREEFLDGGKSFVFFWDKKHREIHEEALLHYFDPSKKGNKFQYQPSSAVPAEEPGEIAAEENVGPSNIGETQSEGRCMLSFYFI